MNRLVHLFLCWFCLGLFSVAWCEVLLLRDQPIYVFWGLVAAAGSFWASMRMLRHAQHCTPLALKIFNPESKLPGKARQHKGSGSVRLAVPFANPQAAVESLNHAYEGSSVSGRSVGDR